MNGNTDLAYTGGAPTTTGTVTLYNSVTAFPPGGCFHLLAQQWYQYSIRSASDGGTGTGTVVGSYSLDKGLTWVPFYQKSTADADDDDAAAVGNSVHDEVYVGVFKDVRFQFVNATEAPTVFDVKHSLHCYKPTSKAVDAASLTGGTPVSITDGAVTSWFRLAHPSTTITGAGYSSIADVLNASSPITQATDNRRPPPATSNNGLPIVTVATSWMPVAVTAARANITTWGVWGWFRPATNADNISSYHTNSGASANRSHLWWNLSGTRVSAEIFTGGGSRFVDTAGLVANTWNFITIEFNGNRSGDARAIISANGVVGTQNYATASGIASMPATLNAVTGTGSFFALGTSGPYFVGSWGPNWGFFGAAMAGATQGLLTTSARQQLMNFEAPA